MDKAKCYCIVPDGLREDAHALELIANFKEMHKDLNVIIISASDFKEKKFDIKRQKIQLDSDLLMKAVKDLNIRVIDSVREFHIGEVKDKRNQNKFRERNFRPNFNYRK